MSDKQHKYSLPAIILHWITAALILSLLLLGWYMADLPKGPDRGWYFALHKSIGLSLFILVVIRAIWRILYPPPALPSYISKSQQSLIHWLHHLLYLMMFLQPISGYLSASFSGYKTKIWNIPLPHWGWKSTELNTLFSTIHEYSSILFIALISLHLMGVFYHIKRGDKEILQRMLLKKTTSKEKNN